MKFSRDHAHGDLEQRYRDPMRMERTLARNASSTHAVAMNQMFVTCSTLRLLASDALNEDPKVHGRGNGAWDGG